MKICWPFRSPLKMKWLPAQPWSAPLPLDVSVLPKSEEETMVIRDQIFSWDIFFTNFRMARLTEACWCEVLAMAEACSCTIMPLSCHTACHAGCGGIARSTAQSFWLIPPCDAARLSDLNCSCSCLSRHWAASLKVAVDVKHDMDILEDAIGKGLGSREQPVAPLATRLPVGHPISQRT